MRWALVLVMWFAGRAAAETRCYAGSQSQDGTPQKIVLEIENDTPGHELREHIWSQMVPAETLATATVAADGTFTWKAKHIGGTGTTFAKAGKLTGYHREANLGDKLLTADTRLDDAKLTMSLRISHDSQLVSTIEIDAKAVDCKDLVAQRAALTVTAPDPNRVCYAGESTIVGVRHDSLVVERSIEGSRIAIVKYFARGEDHLIMDLDGAKISAHNSINTYSGTGTLTGKPGAWTGYKLAITNPNGSQTKIEGTLDATHFAATGSMTIDGKPVVIKDAADAIDCAELAKRKAALK